MEESGPAPDPATGLMDERERADGLALFLDKVSSMSPMDRARLVDEIAAAASRIPVPTDAALIGTPSGFRYQRQAGDPMTRYFTLEADDGVRRGLLRQTAEAEESTGDGVWVATDTLLRAFVSPRMEYEIVEITKDEARERADARGVRL